MKIAVVILHYKGQKLTRKCLASVAELKKRGFELEVVVVDNNPRQKLTGVKRACQNLTLIKTKGNLGFTGGNNLGIEKALSLKADWVLILNNDTIVDRDLMIELIKFSKKNPQVGVIGPKIYFAPGCEYHADRYKPHERGKVFWYAGGLIDWTNVLASHRGVDEVDRGQYDQAGETQFVTGCAMMVSSQVFKKTGLLNDEYYLYLEDSDFCQRAKRAGFQVFYAPKAKLWHVNAGSSQVGGELHDYFLTRNRLLFGLTYAPWRAKLALIKESAKLLLAGRPWQKTAVKDFYQRKFGQGSWKSI